MKQYTLIFLLGLSLAACNNSYEHSFSDEQIAAASKQQDDKVIILERDDLKLTEVHDIPPFLDVSIKLMVKNVSFHQGANELEFNIDRFNLGERTVEETKPGVKVNPSGQYFVLADSVGNKKKFYGANITYELKEGRNSIAGYLCRSYGISLKSDSARYFFQVTNSDLSSEFTEKIASPYLIINSPEDGQVYQKNSKILIDCMKFGFEFDKDKYLEIKVDKTVFKVNKWTAFVLEGLDYGKHKISMKLMDASGKEHSGMMLNGGQVTIEVKEDIVFE